MLCLQALAKMKVRWIYIPVMVRRDLLIVVRRESDVSQDASQAVAIIMHSLGKLNCKWAEMDFNLFTVCIQNGLSFFHRLFGFNNCNLICHCRTRTRALTESKPAG